MPKDVSSWITGGWDERTAFFCVFVTIKSADIVRSGSHFQSTVPPSFSTLCKKSSNKMLPSSSVGAN